MVVIWRWLGGFILLMTAHIGLAAAPIVTAVATKPPPTQQYMQKSDATPVNGQLILLAELEQLQKDMRQLRGMLEVQQHELHQLQQHQLTLYQDLDRRLTKLDATAPKKVAKTTATDSHQSNEPQ